MSFSTVESKVPVGRYILFFLFGIYSIFAHYAKIFKKLNARKQRSLNSSKTQRLHIDRLLFAEERVSDVFIVSCSHWYLCLFTMTAAVACHCKTLLSVANARKNTESVL